MPSGTGVVDAFKNLIRHGKNHTARQHDDSQFQYASPSQQPQQQQQQQQQSGQARDKTRESPRGQQQQQTQKGQTPLYQEELEQIVQQERKAKETMPNYKGLESYKLVEKMGDGAFSNVYKAIDLRTGQKVAVKVVRKYELNASQAGEKHLNKEFKKKPRVTERANILKEVQIMRGINHPSIVKLLQFFESAEHYFLILELMEGGELFHQIVKLTYFSENLARHVILQVAEGIRYLHEERGVVHRDIKPENLLFERIPIIPSKNPQSQQFGEEQKEDEGEFVSSIGGGGIGRVKIADFGLSKVVWDEQTMTPCGTVGYTAPEIVRDERYSKSVDMWAMGCVLYTLLCGFPPFYDEKIDELTQKVAHGQYTFLSPWWDPISSSAKDLISHLLCVNPVQRYTIDEFLNHPWCKAAPGPPPAPTPASELHDMPLDSPLLAAVRGGGREARSPGLATLKEAFDITYAVHRMEEEGARRRAAKGAGGRGFLGGLNEEDEEDSLDEDENVIAEAKQRHDDGRIDGSPSRLRQSPQAIGAGSKTAAKRALQGNGPGKAVATGQRGPAKKSTGFELDMDGATLLGRRHKRGAAGGAMALGSSPLAQKSPYGESRLPDNPGSPMRVD